MASLMENLIDVLGRESTEYEALLQLSQRKTPIIAGGDLAELQKITDEEQELVSRIHNLDRQRAGVTADIADAVAFPARKQGMYEPLILRGDAEKPIAATERDVRPFGCNFSRSRSISSGRLRVCANSASL